MLTTRYILTSTCLAAVAVVASGCGGAGSRSSRGGSGASQPGALSADARSAATGDVPDNQNFLTFRDARAGFSISYPEGWSEKGSSRGVSFRDKNNLVRIAIARGHVPTVAGVRAELDKLRAASPSLRAQPPQTLTVKSGPAVKVSYVTQSAPNPVTGKRVALVVDRYELTKAGKVATIELGTPKGVDNVDAYRMMIESFRWM